MTRAEEIHEAELAVNPYSGVSEVRETYAHGVGFTHGVEYADQHPSDETIMLILNCIGYEEKSWVEFVRKELEKDGII